MGSIIRSAGRAGIGAVAALALLLPGSAIAEEPVADEEEVATESAPVSDEVAPADDDGTAAEPEPEPEPGPAPEAEPVAEVDPDPVGGWAVIDPVTGDVANVIVCRESVCGESGEWGGLLPGDTNCPGCLLRKQTNGTSDGNVAGWRSGGGTTVTYDGDEKGTFTIVSDGSTAGGGTVSQSMTLDPARTATDPERMDLHTGVVRRSTDARFEEDEQAARATVEETRPEGGALESGETTVTFDALDQVFAYESASEAASALEADVDAALVEQGLDEPVASEPEPEAETESAPAVDDFDSETNTVVRAIRTLVERVTSFLSSWFGG